MLQLNGREFLGWSQWTWIPPLAHTASECVGYLVASYQEMFPEHRCTGGSNVMLNGY
jgi:hypothetical protein